MVILDIPQDTQTDRQTGLKKLPSCKLCMRAVMKNVNEAYLADLTPSLLTVDNVPAPP